MILAVLSLFCLVVAELWLFPVEGGKVALLPFYCCERTLKIVNSQGEKTSFGSQSERFQPVVACPNTLGLLHNITVGSTGRGDKGGAHLTVTGKQPKRLNSGCPLPLSLQWPHVLPRGLISRRFLHLSTVPQVGNQAFNIRALKDIPGPNYRKNDNLI